MYSTGAGANRIAWGDLAMMDTPAAYTIAFDLYLNATGAVGVVFSKYDHGTEPWKGWRCYIAADDKLYLNHGNGVDANVEVAATTAYSGSTYYRCMVSWDGTNADFYKNGAADGTPAFSQTLTANSQTTCIGSDDGGGSNSPNGYIGHVMWWDAALTADEAAMHYAGVIPRAPNLKFWAPGWSDPGMELVGQASGTKAGTVTIVEDITKSVPYFFGACSRILYGINSIYKVANDTLGLSEAASGIRFPYEVIDETLGLSDDQVAFFTRVHAVSETMGLQDYCTEGSGEIAPDGLIEETMSDGTVWTRVFPPFARRTAWTGS